MNHIYMHIFKETFCQSFDTLILSGIHHMNLFPKLITIFPRYTLYYICVMTYESL